MKAERTKRQKARTSFTEFCRYVAPDEPPADHHEILCNACDQVLAGEIRNLMVFMPPGSAKSTYASVRFPAYFLGRKKKKSIICASYGDELATSFGRKVRNLVSTANYKNVFPETSLAQDSQAKGEWETGDGGSYFAVGVGGGVTGRRADLGLVDDPVKGRKEADSEIVKESTWQWYNSDFLSRLKPGAAQIIIQTRWVEDDLSGRILPEDWNGESGVFVGRDGKTWHVICLQAEAEGGKNDPLGRDPGEWLWPEWFTPEYWEETKRAQQISDIRNWSALYQQRPSPHEGTFFKREWFKRFNLGDEPNTNKYQSSDYAVSEGGGDFTELGVWGVCPESDLWALGWWHGQESTDTWIDAQLDQIKSFKTMCSFGESGVIRKAMEPYLNKQSRTRKIYTRFEWISRTKDKAAMARAFQGMAAAGKVHIPYTDWGERLIDQLCAFPAGKYDDGVDVCALIAMAIEEAHPAIVLPEPEEPEKDAWGRYNKQGGESWKTV